MGSVGTSRSLRGQARAHTFTDVGASEGFAAARVIWICVLWALIHSVLASKQAKNLARRVAGSRYRDGLYRSTYNVQSVVLLLWAARRFARLPDRELYRVSSPWSWLLRTSQVASLVAFGRAGYGYIKFRWNNAAMGLPQRKGHSPRTGGSRTPYRRRRRGGDGGGVPLHPPPGQPRCFGVPFVHASHDGEPRCPHSTRNPLHCPWFYARRVQTAGSVRRCLRALQEGSPISSTPPSAKVEVPRCVPRGRAWVSPEYGVQKA
jgi:hypothetical protein